MTQTQTDRDRDTFLTFVIGFESVCTHLNTTHICMYPSTYIAVSLKHRFTRSLASREIKVERDALQEGVVNHPPSALKAMDPKRSAPVSLKVYRASFVINIAGALKHNEAQSETATFDIEVSLSRPPHPQPPPLQVTAITQS